MLKSLKRRSVRSTILFVAILTAAFLISKGPLLNCASAQTTQAYTWKNVVTGGGGGFISGIVFNTSAPDLIYARTDIGGAYRWDPGTSRWIALMDWVSFDEWNLTGVESIATDPVDPNRLYIAAGTYTNEWTTMNGAILRSTNRGNTFQRTNLPFKVGGNMPGRSMGERLAVDPNRNSTIYFGARSGNGLWRSTDFGVTWSRVTSFTANATYVERAGDVYLGDTDGVVWETFDPRTGSAGNATQTIYVGIADKGNSIYRSTNGGTTWSALAGQPTGFLPHHAVLSSTGMLYITYSNGAGPYDGGSGDVWKYDTATGIWTRISPVPSTDTQNNFFGYGGLAVDALHPNTIMVSALNSWWPDTIIFRSTNAGATWTRIWDWGGSGRTFRYLHDITAAPWLDFGGNAQPPEVAPKLGWMVGDLEIDPFNSDRMLYGTGATLYGSDDLTRWDTGTPIHITVKAQGIEETAVQDLISPPSGPPLLSALGDVNGYRHDNLAIPPAKIFTTPTTASSTSIDYAELMTNFIVRVGNVDKSLHPQINRCGFSFDGGTSWFQGSEPGGVTGGGTVAANANATRVVWSPEGTGPHVSANNGSSWTASTGIPAGAKVAADRVNPNKFYGFSNGTFYASVNGGTSFTAAATGLPSFARIKAVPSREGDIWLAGGEGGLWHSTNNGATFTKLTNVEEADTIGFGMAAPGQSYMALYSSAQVGGVRGIYRSDNAGATWIRINDDQHQYASTNNAITGDPRVYGRVYISTNGRGIIYGEPSGVVTPDFSISANPSSLTINRGANGTSTINITRTGGFASSVAFTVSGLPAGVTASFNPTPAAGASSVLTLTASSTATLGAATVTVTGTGGSLTRTTPISLTVSSAPTGTGGVTVTPIVSANGQWFNEEVIRLSNTAPLTALSVTIVIQRTTGISFSGQFNSVGSQITQSNSSTASAITYQFTLAAGQTLGTGTNWTFATQTSGTGTIHPTAGDTFTVTYTTGGQTFTQTGHF